MNKHSQNPHKAPPDTQAADQAAPKMRKAKPAKRTCIMVLGMHRTGTSALTRVLSLLGAELPKNLLPPVAGNNEGGFWESQPLMVANKRMLAEAGSSWDDWRPFTEAVLRRDRLNHHKDEIRKTIESEFGDAPFIVIKDPRISRFVPVYKDVLASLGISPFFVHSNRNPKSVIASLGARDQFNPTFAALLWLRHELDAEAATRGQPRIFVSYEQLMTEWRTPIERILRATDFKWPKSISHASGEIETFLTPAQNHHSFVWADVERDATLQPWLKDAYRSLKRLEEDPNDRSAIAALDGLKQQFDCGSAVFGDAVFPELLARQERLKQQAVEELRATKAESEAARAETGFARSEAAAAKAGEAELRGRMSRKLRSLSNDLRTIRLARNRAEAIANQAKAEAKKAIADDVASRRHLLSEIQSLSRRMEVAQAALEKARSEIKAARAAEQQSLEMHKRADERFDAVRRSTSWRVTAPIRVVKRAATERGYVRHLAAHLSRSVYERLKLGRIIDWQIAGAPIRAARQIVLRTELRVVFPTVGPSALPKPAAAFSAQPRVLSKKHHLEIRGLLDKSSGREIGDPLEEIVAYAQNLITQSTWQPKISVVMPTWNRESTVSNALRSALAQSLPPFEIIVSDDGSTDKTLETIASDFPQQVASGQIKILRNEHGGVSAARNAALTAVTGDLTAYLDSDNTWRPHFLLLMAAAFVESDEVDIGYAGLLQENLGSGRTLVRGRDFDRAQLLQGNFIDLNVLVHKRKLYQQFGGFCRDLKRLVDWDLIIRYTHAYQPFYLPFIGVDYKLSPSLNNITNTQPLQENYSKVAVANRPERISLGVEPLKLAYFVYDYPALSQTFVLAEIRELLKRGTDLKVYYSVQPDVIAELDFEVESYQVANAEELARLFVQHDRNICHSHFAYPGVTNFVRPACHTTGVYYTFMPHAVDIFHENNRKRSKVGELGADPFCLKIMVYGDHHRNFLESQGVPREKIAYTFQAVDLSEFEKVRVNRQKAAKNSKFKIAAIGRFIEKKGFGDLISAVGLLKNSDIELDLYGYGPLEDELRSLVKRLELKNVNFRGAVKGIAALADVYAKADMLAAPCVEAKNGDVDGFPTVILEAMVAGIPVLTTSVSAIPDYIRDGVEGIVVPPHNPQAIASAIATFHQSTTARKSAMLSRATALVERMIGVDKTVQRLLDVWLGYKVDIILVTFNNKKYDDRQETLEILKRVFAHTTTNFHLTIVDNNSDEDFWDELVASVEGRPNVQLIRKRENVFCGPASNIAIGHGDAESIIYLCSKEGFIKEHGWERTLIDTMRKQPRVGLAGHLAHLPKHTLGSELAKHPAFHLFRNTEFAESNPSRRFGHIQGGAKIIRRAMFETVGGYNDATPQDNMDVELSHCFESHGFELFQLNEVASVTRKTLPGLEAILDEKTIVAHPLDIETVRSRLDALKNPFGRFCNMCGGSFDAFKTSRVHETEAQCPTCDSLPLERLVYRAFANAPYIHRGGRLAILAKTKALPKKAASRMFKSVITLDNQADFIRSIQAVDRFSCIVLDSDLVSGEEREFWALLARKIDANGEVLVAEPHDGKLIAGRDELGRFAEVLAERAMKSDMSFFDVTSQKCGYDQRRLRRITISPVAVAQVG